MKTFPFILHEILSDPESQNIITWMPHGCSWRVLDKEKLAKVICPKYFSHSKFEHFTRSVNGWGFKRCTKDGPNFRSFRHPYFLRGEINLCRLIKRPTFHTNLLDEAIDSEDEEKVVTIDQDETRYFNGICYQLPRAIIPNYEMPNPGYYHMPHQQWQLQITSHADPVASVLQSNHYLFHYGYVPYYSYANPNIPPNIDQRAHPPLFPPFVQGYPNQYPVGHFSTSNTAALPCSWNPLAQQQHHQYLLDWCEQLQQERQPSTRYHINPCRENSLSLRDTSLPRCKSCERPCRSHGTDVSMPLQTLMHMVGSSPPLPTSSYFHSQPCTHRSQYQWQSKDMNYNSKTARLSRPQPVPSQSRLSSSSGHSFATASSQPMDNARLHVSHPMSMQEIVLGGDGDKDHMNAAIIQKCKFPTTGTKSLHSTTSSEINVMAKPMSQSIETQRGEALQLRSSMSESKIQSANQKTSLVSIDMHENYRAFDPRTAEIQEKSSHALPQNRILLHPRPFQIPIVNPRDDGQSTSTLGLDKATSPSQPSDANSFTFTKLQTLAHGLAVQEGVDRSKEGEDEVNEDEDKSERSSDEKPEKNQLPDQMSPPEGNDGNEFTDHLGVEMERELDHCRTHGDNSTLSFDTCDEGVRLSNEKKRGRNPMDIPSLHDADVHATKVRKISPDTQSNEVNHPQLNSLRYLDDCEASTAHANIGYSAKTPGAMDQIEPSNCGISVPLIKQCDRDNEGKVQENGQGQMIESEEMRQFKPFLYTDHSRHSENIHFGFEDVDMEPYTQIFSLSFSPFDENNSP